MTKTNKDIIKVGDYIVYDNPNYHSTEGVVIETVAGSYVEIESIDGSKRVFTEKDFKFLTKMW